MEGSRPQNQISEEQIVKWLQSADFFDRGFRALTNQYKAQLYGHIRRMVHNHDDADDVLQNTFIKVYKGISQFEGKSKLYTWMYRIATNEALTFLKSSSRHAHKPLEDWNSSGSQADTWMDADEVQRKLQLAIDELPEKQKVVFLLRYHDEMPYEEMSEVLNTSVGALKASFHHAVRKIEQIVREWE